MCLGKVVAWDILQGDSTPIFSGGGFLQPYLIKFAASFVQTLCFILQLKLTPSPCSFNFILLISHGHKRPHAHFAGPRVTPEGGHPISNETLQDELNVWRELLGLLKPPSSLKRSTLLDDIKNTCDGRSPPSVDTSGIAIIIMTVCVCVCVRASAHACVCGCVVSLSRRVDICTWQRVSILSRFENVIDGRSIESSTATQPCMMSPFCRHASFQTDDSSVDCKMLQNMALSVGPKSFFFFSSSTTVAYI